jgi:hypothetical protein
VKTTATLKDAFEIALKTLNAEIRLQQAPA